MYWQIVGMTDINCWIISTNTEESLQFHPERTPSLNAIVIGGSIKNAT